MSVEDGRETEREERRAVVGGGHNIFALIRTSSDFQQERDGSTIKSKLYAEVAKKVARVGFNRTTEQITDILKKVHERLSRHLKGFK